MQKQIGTTEWRNSRPGATVAPAHADAHVRKALGADYMVVKIGGYWVIGTRDAAGGFVRVSPDPLRKSLTLAVGDVRKTLAEVK